MLGKGKQLLLSIVDTAPAVCHDAINLIFFARQKSFHLHTAIVPRGMQTATTRFWNPKPTLTLYAATISGDTSGSTCSRRHAGNTPDKVNLCGKWKRKSVKMIWVDSSHSEASPHRWVSPMAPDIVRRKCVG